MLAARDQENLLHSHQTVAAAKPLNQGVRQLPPKTPGNKQTKTPFKVPLNDENGIAGFAKNLRPGNNGGKNEVLGNQGGLGGKNALVTPMGQRNRAPLGMKTTNAKTRAFQTPAPARAPEKSDGIVKPSNASTRKAKQKVSIVEPPKIDVLDIHDGLIERDVEYMPPKPKDLADIPDDIPTLDLPPLGSSDLDKDEIHQQLLYTAATMIGEDGLTSAERQERWRKEHDDRQIRREEAEMLCECESLPIPCFHIPECPGKLCKATIENRQAARERLRKTLATIDAEEKPAWKRILEMDGGLPPLPAAATTSKIARPKVSATVGNPKAKAPIASAKVKLNASLATRPRKTSATAYSSPMRHNMAVAASKTTIGYSKGRITSTTLEKPTQTGKEEGQRIPSNESNANLSLAEYKIRYGSPPLGSDMWFRYLKSDFLDQEQEDREETEDSLSHIFRRDAEIDFELVLQD